MSYEERQSRERAEAKARVSKFIRYGVLTLIGLIAVSVFSSSWYTVPEGYVAVITRNGAVIGEAQPGLDFKVPMIDQAHDMSIQTQRVNFENVASYSKDIQQATSYVTVNYKLLPGVVSQTYSTVGLNYEGTLMNARVFKHLKETFGKYNAVDIINQRDKISDHVEQILRDDMAQFGISIEDVQIANIDFSDAYEHAAEKAATAQAEVVQARQQLEKAKVDAQVQVANAQAAAEATKAKADAEAYRVKAEADADAHRLAVQGAARAEALSSQVKALGSGEAVVQNNALLMWDGKLPTTMVPGSTVPFMNTFGQK